MTIIPGMIVQTENEDNALVVRIDEKSQRAVLYFIDPDAQGYASMRRLTTLTPVKYPNGRVRKIKDMKAAVAACKSRSFS